MINYDDVMKENIKKHNPDWPQISNHPYKMLITGGSGSGKTNALLNLIKKQDADNYRVIENIVFYILKIQMKQNIYINKAEQSKGFYWIFK